MRRVRSSVSHRIRRQPSIFSVRWFRLALGAGLALVVVLLVWPSVAAWFGGDIPRSLFLLLPWSTSSKATPTGPLPPTAPGLRVASPIGPPASGVASGTAAATDRVAGSPAMSGTPPPASPSVTPAAPVKPPPRAAAASAAPEATPPRTGSLTAPPAVYWVQVGAFQDHRNADRLVERLRSDGVTAATTSFEQTRVLYRVLLVGGEGGRTTDELTERVRGLGHAVEATADGPAVSGLVPLRRAVETSHTLKQQGVPVRLKQEVSSTTFRVVRVGSFATIAEADAALASLAAKGVEGVVVRER